MTLEAPTLFPEPIEAHSPPGKGKHGYYRRSDDGGPAANWIVIAATTPTNRSDYEYKGFTYLQKYGEFKNGTNEARAAEHERDAKGNPWNPAREPWRLIFQMNGAKEFPVSQIIEYRWHIRPPYREVTFPQLEGVEVTDYYCPECDKGVFSSVNPQEAAQQLRSHLTSGVGDAHKYTPADLQALGKEYGIDFSSARVGRRPVSAPEPVATKKKYVCEGCGYEPQGKSPWLALKNHKCLAPAGAAQEGVD